jgi:branched-chain amino acid aminotransferase
MPRLKLETTTAYLRGEFVPFEHANLSIASSPVLYGLAVYTVCAAHWNDQAEQLYLFRLHDHYQRLVHSARIADFADFAAAYSYEDFRAVVLELLQKNDVREDALVRMTWFVDALAAGTRIRGLDAALSIYVYPAGDILPRGGAHACISSWTRTSDNMIPSRAKLTGSYINASLMKNEALVNGYDEAISLDASGHVAEGSVANIFVVRHGRLITPDTSTDILEGITRNSVLHLAGHLGIPTEERPVDRTELYVADELMMVGSSARITPILSVDRRPVGHGQPGSITGKLSDSYRDLTHGQNDKRWLTEVYHG